MTRRLLLWLPLLAVLGCSADPRINADCEWTLEPPGALDVETRSGQRHLVDDVDLAEDLAIRHTDAVKRRVKAARLRRQPSGFQADVGVIQIEPLKDECLATLFGTIASTHHLRLDQVRQARGRRNAEWDVAVILGFAVFYAWATWVMTGLISRRFPNEDGWPALAAPLVAAFGVSLAGVTLGELWATAMEMVRVGNDHLSYRGLRLPWARYRLELFVGGVALFWLVALQRFLGGRADSQPETHDSARAGGTAS